MGAPKLAPVSVAYFVSRFPHVSETFIVREMDAVADAGVDIDLFSLFPPTGSVVHPAAERWLPALRRGRLGGGVAGLLWWLWRRPARVLSSLAAIVRGYWRRPALAARALVTFVIACGHARSLAAANVTHIHAHYATYPALAAWLCWRLTALPYSFTAHAHDLFVDQSMLARKVRDAGFVVAISEFNRRFLAAHGAGPGGTEVHVVHCGIDPDAYSFRPRSAPPEGPVDALCVASLQEYKGHEVLLTALATGAGLERLHLDLVGDGELRPHLERLAARLGVASRVRFAGGLTEIEVRSRLDNADLFVLPSIVAGDGQMEGLPVVLMEALACGIPTVATRLSGVPELISDGETGLLAEPGEPGSLADALNATLADPDAARRRAERGRAKVVAEFDICDSGVRMAALFRATPSPGG